jgi:endoglucanase
MAYLLTCASEIKFYFYITNYCMRLLRCSLFPVAIAIGISAMAIPPLIDNHIKVDQFGYRTTDKKIAVISNPQVGYNSTDSFSPGSNYQIRRWSDDAFVYAGIISQWNSGATHAQSGDKVWWFDFTAVTTPGSYYVFDVVNNVGSYKFEIGDCVYKNVMKQALRAFYYQRCGCAKALPYAQTGWTDAVCHAGALQDADCRLYSNTAASTSRNLSGGWHDAGDYNKYVNFAFEPLLDLMFAYAESPGVWSDDYDIPESGNSIPDILDEVKYELDWLLRMQQSDGSVLSVVGTQNFASASPPSADNAQRLYGPATTSASFTAAAVFAFAAIQFNSIGQSVYGNTLMNAAESAYNWAVANSGITFYNSGIIAAGEQEVQPYDVLVRKMTASVFLFELTGNNAYQTFVDNNYSSMHLIQWGYAYPFEAAQQNMLLYYAAMGNATVSVANDIKNNYTASMQTNNPDNLPAFLNQTDAYRAYMSDNNYTWGSNTTKARQGIMFSNMVYYNLDAANNSNYTAAALGFVNYFHGINPTAFAYLSNMGNFEGDNSINEFYHSWFTDGSALWDRVGSSTYGPPPGFVPGGPNPTYSVDACCPLGCASVNALCNAALVTPPLNQPVQKSYLDWNTGWPQNSWTVTEIGIYTQAAYVRLLSHFLDISCFPTSVEEEKSFENAVQIFPNPFRTSATVRIYDVRFTIYDFVLCDITGREVLNLKHQTSNIKLSRSSLQSGIYFYKIKSDCGITGCGKIVIE